MMKVYLTKLGFDSKLPLGEGLKSALLLGSLERLLVAGESLPHGPGLLVSQVQGLVLLALVELPQVLLLLLVHHDVDAGDGLPDDADLGELGGGSSGHLGHSQLGKFSLEVIQLLGQVFLLLLTKLRALDLTHFVV